MRRVLIFKVSFVLLFLLGILAPATVSAQTEDTYIVQPGDTLRDIAAIYNSSVEAIAARNGIINTNTIRVGQVLYIPRPGSNVNATVNTYTVQHGDTLRDIAIRYNTTVSDITAINNISSNAYIYPGQTLTLPRSGVTAPQRTVNTATTTQRVIYRQTVNGYYHVQHGDTMLVIAHAFGVDAWTIARANGIYNLNRIYAGQALRIPGY